MQLDTHANTHTHASMHACTHTHTRTLNNVLSKVWIQGVLQYHIHVYSVSITPTWLLPINTCIICTYWHMSGDLLNAPDIYFCLMEMASTAIFMITSPSPTNCKLHTVHTPERSNTQAVRQLTTHMIPPHMHKEIIYFLQDQYTKTVFIPTNR